MDGEKVRVKNSGRDSFQIVMAHYMEGPSWLNPSTSETIVYTKGMLDASDAQASSRHMIRINEKIKQSTFATQISFNRIAR
jgi:hypothetical protein